MRLSGHVWRIAFIFYTRATGGLTNTREKRENGPFELLSSKGRRLCFYTHRRRWFGGAYFTLWRSVRVCSLFQRASEAAYLCLSSWCAISFSGMEGMSLSDNFPVFDVSLQVIYSSSMNTARDWLLGSKWWGAQKQLSVVYFSGIYWVEISDSFLVFGNSRKVSYVETSNRLMNNQEWRSSILCPH